MTAHGTKMVLLLLLLLLLSVNSIQQPSRHYRARNIQKSYYIPYKETEVSPKGNLKILFCFVALLQMRKN